MNGHTVLSNNGQHEQQDYEVPPTCVLMGIVRRLGKSSAEATEETVARACWQYGRVLDARVRGDDVHVFFESEAAALRCQWQLNVIDGVTPTRLCTENIDYIHVEVKVNYEANTEMELALGRQCTQYGRVIEAVSNGKSIHLAMATETGAAASVIGLESGENEIVDSASLRLSDSESSPFVFVPQSALKKNNISEEDMKKEFQRFGEVLDISRSENVQIQFATSTQAARCCAEVTSSQFCVRGSICRKFDSEFAAQVIATLPMTLIEKTIRALRHEIDSIPRNHQAFALLAGALLRLDAERYADEALEHAQTAIELAPKFAWGHFRKGSALLAMGHVAKAATSLGLASSLDSENTELAHAAVRVKQTAEKLLDPLDAFVATEINAEAAEQLIQAVHSQRQAEIETDTKKRKRLHSDKDDDDENTLDYNPRAHCYVCKQWGHTKRDCPLAKCQYCFEIGHKKSECPLLTAALANAAAEEKNKKRKAFYEKKKIKRKEEWTKHLREQTGIEGYAALYRVLGLPERRLASPADIKKAYHRRSLEFHPDKHPNNREEAHERFLEIRSAYELLIEGMESNNGINGKAVHSAGELTDAAAAQALQERVKTLTDKVKSSRTWAG